MATVYLIEQNTVLRKTSDRLVLTKKPPGERTTDKSYSQADVLLEIPCADIDHVMLFGNIQVTTQALQELLQHGIELALFTFTGKLLGQLTPPESKNIELRIAQFAKYRQNDFCLSLAKAIVRSKLASAFTLVQKHAANHPGLFTSEELKELKSYLDRAESAENLDSLRGYEGSGTACYYNLFGRMLEPPWKFDGRNRQPPRDPVNAVLSFGYVIVGAELQSLLDGIGFEPYLGFYHQVKYGRPSLALDLVEEFRHSLVDRLALFIFNRHMVSEADFSPMPEGGIYLNTGGKAKFFQHYETMLGKLVAATDGAGAGKGFRSAFQQQIYALAKTVRSDQPYVPFAG